MKKYISISLLVFMLAMCTACGDIRDGDGFVNSVSGSERGYSSAAPSETVEPQEAGQVVQEFFAAAEEADYDAMKALCTESFAEDYFQENQETESWFGFRNAKLQTSSLLADDDGAFMRTRFPEAQSGCLFHIEIKGETVPESALWSEEEPVQEGCYTLLVQNVDGSWKIAGITTE